MTRTSSSTTTSISRKMKQLSILDACMTAYRRRAKTRATAKPEMESPEQQLPCPMPTTELRTRAWPIQQNPTVPPGLSTTFAACASSNVEPSDLPRSIGDSGGPATHHRWISSPSLGISTTSTVCISTDTDTTFDALSSSRDVFPFFRLPGELRNKIYRYVILEDTVIHVSNTGYQRSGFLAASKQIRDETIKIFYHENQFLVAASAHCSDTLLRFTCVRQELQLHCGPGLGKPILINVHDGPNWRNLMIWLQRCHSCELTTGYPPPGEIPRATRSYARQIAVAALFAITRQLRDLPWAHVKEILLEQRPILVNTDARWEHD